MSVPLHASDAPIVDPYVEVNRHSLAAFDDDGHSEWNGVDGRILRAFARRGLVWFECVDPWGRRKRYRGGLTAQGLQALAILESREPPLPWADMDVSGCACHANEGDTPT